VRDGDLVSKLIALRERSVFSEFHVTGSVVVYLTISLNRYLPRSIRLSRRQLPVGVVEPHREMLNRVSRAPDALDSSLARGIATKFGIDPAESGGTGYFLESKSTRLHFLPTTSMLIVKCSFG